MENIANSVLLQKPDTSEHNLSEELKTTTSLGRITPVYIAEVVPGDRVDLNAEFLTKFQPMATPAFQNFTAYVHYFYVPFRILWKNWKYFIQNQPAPDGIVPPHPPILDLSAIDPDDFLPPNINYIFNYFGINGPDNMEAVNALPFSAYQLIYNEYYRHEQIHPDLTQDILLTDGSNNANLTTLSTIRYRTYKDDYFTSALKAPQSGNEASLALATDKMLHVRRNHVPVSGETKFEFNGQELPSGTSSDAVVNNLLNTDPTLAGNELYVDPNDASYAVTMNDLIELNRMQEFLVRQNLAGNRYNEYILAFFGVRVPDLRLDRPDYITGVKAPVTISEVINTAGSQGYQTGQGNSFAEGGRGNYEVLEHGIIMGLYTCIPSQSYLTSIQRLFYKLSYEDYYVPIFDQMGEREIINKELEQNHVDPYGTFGYVPKFAEYRLPFNKITGEFGTTLTTWHLANIYDLTQVLDESFFDIRNPDRVFQVGATNADSILIWLVNKVIISRPMKKYAMPVLSNNYGNNIF